MPHILRADQIVGQWEVPVKGTLRNMPIYKLPSDALWSAHNVLVRSGFLQPRPGLTQFNATVMTGRPTGMFTGIMLATGAFQADTFDNGAFQVAGSIPASLLLVGTTDKVYGYYGGVLNDITGAPDLTALDTQPARFTSIALGTPQTLYIIHVNGMDAPRQWDVTSGTFSAVSGSPPTFTDITNIDQHIIGIVPPYNISWAPTQSITSWPAANTRVLSDTPGALVAIHALGVRQGVVYKTDGIWDVIPTGSDLESAYFRFEQRDIVQGPASAAAIVDVDGAHLYMTRQGRVGYYDGSRHFWVAEGTWPITRVHLDTDNADRIFGAYDPRYKVALFVYPNITGAGGDLAPLSLGDGECFGWVMVMLPNPSEGYDGFISFHGSSSLAFSAGGTLREGQEPVLLARSTSGSQKLYTWDDSAENESSLGFSPDGDDAGTAFSGHFQTGLVPTPGLEFFTLEAYETLALQRAGYGSITVKPVSSFVLDATGGTVGSAKTVSLEPSTSDKVLGKPKGSDLRGRFWGLRYEFTVLETSASVLRWMGARLSANLRKG